jgi:hypothetical protein
MARLGKPVAALAGGALVGLAALVNASDRPPTEQGPPPPLAQPTMVALDYQGQPFMAVVKSIAQRSSIRVDERGAFPKGVVRQRDPDWWSRKVTLQSKRPVPFWEAIDRLSDAAHAGYQLASFGDTGSESTGVVFGEGEALPGRAAYAGPFRVGLAGVHQYRETIFVREPWVKVYPGGFAAPAGAPELGEAPADGGPLYVELQVLAEPGVIGRRDGPLADLEAVDEAGRSLLAPGGAAGAEGFPAHAPFSRGASPPVRVPLRRVDAANKVIRRLRGAIPVEIAVVKPQPALVIKLAGSEGKTFHGGGAEFSVKTARVEPSGEVKVELTGRIGAENDPTVRSSRLTLFMKHQYRIVDAKGVSVRAGNASSGGDREGRFTLRMDYQPGLGSGPPAEFRYHDLDRVHWALPFEFRDIPLP